MVIILADVPLHRFQEQLLARRAVFFLDGRIYFRCRGDEYAEQLADQRPRGGTSSGDVVASLLPLTAELNDPLSDFATMLLYYSRRALTLPSDVLRALDGITRRVSKLSHCRFFQGAPTAAFDVFLIFKVNTLGGGLSRRPGFPSYSWAGWKGGLVLGSFGWTFEALNQWLEECTWIVWYKRSPSGVLSLVWDLGANESFPVNDLGYPGYRKRRPFSCPPGVVVNPARTYPTEDLTNNPIPMTVYPLLQFWTLSVHFHIQLLDNALTGVADIVSAKGTRVGTVYLDGVEETAIFASHDTFEFILLSRVMRDTYFKEVEDCYHVMLLEWHGPVSERGGLGVLHISAVVDCLPPGPTWKEIVLG